MSTSNYTEIFKTAFVIGAGISASVAVIYGAAKLVKKSIFNSMLNQNKPE